MPVSAVTDADEARPKRADAPSSPFDAWRERKAPRGHEAVHQPHELAVDNPRHRLAPRREGREAAKPAYRGGFPVDPCAGRKAAEEGTRLERPGQHHAPRPRGETGYPRPSRPLTRKADRLAVTRRRSARERASHPGRQANPSHDRKAARRRGRCAHPRSRAAKLFRSPRSDAASQTGWRPFLRVSTAGVTVSVLGRVRESARARVAGFQRLGRGGGSGGLRLGRSCVQRPQAIRGAIEQLDGRGVGTGSPPPVIAGGTIQCPTSDAPPSTIHPAAARACRARTAHAAESTAVATATPTSRGPRERRPASWAWSPWRRDPPRIRTLEEVAPHEHQREADQQPAEMDSARGC